MEIWRAQVDRKERGEHRSIRYHLRYHVGTLLAFLRGIMSGSCVTPAADCGVGVHCLAGSNLPISVISRVMGEGIYIAFY